MASEALAALRNFAAEMTEEDARPRAMTRGRSQANRSSTNARRTNEFQERYTDFTLNLTPSSRQAAEDMRCASNDLSKCIFKQNLLYAQLQARTVPASLRCNNMPRVPYTDVELDREWEVTLHETSTELMRILQAHLKEAEMPHIEGRLDNAKKQLAALGQLTAEQVDQLSECLQKERGLVSVHDAKEINDSTNATVEQYGSSWETYRKARLPRSPTRANNRRRNGKNRSKSQQQQQQRPQQQY